MRHQQRKMVDKCARSDTVAFCPGAVTKLEMKARSSMFDGESNPTVETEPAAVTSRSAGRFPDEVTEFISICECVQQARSAGETAIGWTR